MKNYLKVTAVSAPKQDDGEKQQHRTYKTIEFATPDKIEIAPGMFAKTEPKVTSINLYEKSYLDDKMQFGYDSKVGEFILGDIVTRKVRAYEIPAEGTKPARTVNTYSTVVLGDSTSGSWESKVASTFKSKGHELDNTPSNFSIANQESLAAFEAEKAAK